MLMSNISIVLYCSVQYLYNCNVLLSDLGVRISDKHMYHYYALMSQSMKRIRIHESLYFALCVCVGYYLGFLYLHGAFMASGSSAPFGAIIHVLEVPGVVCECVCVCMSVICSSESGTTVF